MNRRSSIENIVSTDILLELFQYLYVDELFALLDNVIHQFPVYLKNNNVRLYVRHIDAHFRKCILPNIDTNYVTSIRIENMYHMAQVNLCQFSQARVLRLYNVTSQNWPLAFPKNLKSLIVHVRSKDRSNVFKQALSLENIERLEFNSNFLHFHDCNDRLENPSTIKHLEFNSQRCFIDYQFLLTNMPYLKTLKSTNVYYPHRYELNSDKFNHLHTIDLVCKHVDIVTMIFFLTSISSDSLRCCRLINTSSSLSPNGALDIILWQDWLERDALNLKRLHVLLKFGFDNYNSMVSTTKTFNANPYFKSINFKLKPINEYQALLIGCLNR